MTLLQRELVFLTGKGGVGKTTVAAALALAAARRGRRVALCEVAGQARAPRLLRGATASAAAGRPGEERPVAENLWTTTIDPQRALEEWAARQVGSRRVAHAMAGAHAFSAFLHAAPGARELATIAKAWELGRRERWTRDRRSYDVVVVDGPASGHGLAMLRTPRTYAEIARVGPIAAQARLLVQMLEDRARTAMVAVALPAELPVSETLDLEGRVRAALARDLDAIVVNGVLPRRFSADEVARVAAAAAAGDGADGTDGAVPAALAAAVRRQHGQAGAQQAQLRRLRRDALAPVLTLPFVAVPALGPEQVGELADVLGRRLA